MRKSLLLLAVLALLSGCNKADTVSYAGVEAGLLGSGQFTSDNGVTMTVDGNEGAFDILTTRRVLLSYQTHPVESAARITIDLRALWEAEIVQPAAIPAMPEEVDDTPLGVTGAWFSGGYMNLLTEFKAVDPARCTFSIDFTVNANGPVLRLRLDGSEDAEGTPEKQASFVCVPMGVIVQAFDQYCLSLGRAVVSPVPVRLQWTGYASEGGTAVLLEKEGSYTPAS